MTVLWPVTDITLQVYVWHTSDQKNILYWHTIKDSSPGQFCLSLARLASIIHYDFDPEEWQQAALLVCQ
jgi:hypothetical protein